MANTTKDINKKSHETWSKSYDTRERGNAMIYVLIALALFGFLTITLSGQNDQVDGQNLDDEQAEFYAIELMEYAASAQQAVDMMIYTGSTIDELDFVTPDDAAFNTPPHQHKVFHPQGGGLTYVLNLPEGVANFIAPYVSGWFATNSTNVEWTPSGSDDVVLSALRIKEEICAILNEKITGSRAIPQITIGLDALFETGADLNTTRCPSCENHSSLCVLNSSGTNWGYYNVIAGQ